MMRKLLLAVLGSILIFTNGCGKEETPNVTTSSGGGKSITIWWAQWAPADGLAELGKDYEKATGVVVNVHQIPWPSYQDQVFLNFTNSKTDFDVVIGDSQWLGRGATNKLYVDLTDWLPTAVDLKTVHPIAIKYLCEYPASSGKYFAAPCETDAVGFAYRKDWFADAKEKDAFKAKYGRELDVPKTWDEFRDVAEFFYRPDQKRFGCAILTGRDYDSLTMGFQQIMWAFGGSWDKVNTPETESAIAFVQSLIKFGPNGASNFSYDKTLESFNNGTTAMAMDYFAFYPGIVKVMGDKAGFFMVPKKGDKQVISLGGQGFSISTKVSADQQKLAKDFIAWFLKKENQQKWITKEAGFTANTEILASDAFRKATPYNAPFADSLDHLQDFYNVPVYNELLAAAQRNIGEAIDGTKPAKQALDELAKELDRIKSEK